MMEKKCCCRLSNRAGTIILALIIIIFSIIPIVINFLPSIDVDTSHQIVDTVEYSFAILAGLLAILACCCKRAVLMTPVLVILGLLIVFVSVRLVLCVVGLFVPDSIIPNFIREVRKTDDDIFQYTVVYTIVNAVHILVLLFIFPVFRGCYHDLREQIVESSQEAKTVVVVNG